MEIEKSPSIFDFRHTNIKHEKVGQSLPKQRMPMNIFYVFLGSRIFLFLERLFSLTILQVKCKDWITFATFRGNYFLMMEIFVEDYKIDNKSCYLSRACLIPNIVWKLLSFADYQILVSTSAQVMPNSSYKTFFNFPSLKTSSFPFIKKSLPSSCIKEKSVFISIVCNPCSDWRQ